MNTCKWQPDKGTATLGVVSDPALAVQA